MKLIIINKETNEQIVVEDFSKEVILQDFVFKFKLQNNSIICLCDKPFYYIEEPATINLTKWQKEFTLSIDEAANIATTEIDNMIIYSFKLIK